MRAETLPSDSKRETSALIAWLGLDPREERGEAASDPVNAGDRALGPAGGSGV
jgi:hypothetical protein